MCLRLLRNTLVLYPAGKKKKQRFATGDDTGTLNCFEMKKGEATVSLSTFFQA